MNPVDIMSTPSDPSAMRMRSRKYGSVNLVMPSVTTRNMPVPMNTPRISDFIFPYSLFVARTVISFMKVIANTLTGMAMNPANCVSGITAPSSDGSTCFGTSHRPTNAFKKSAVRQAQKIMMEYHQKSPSLACSFASIDVCYSTCNVFAATL